MNAATKIELLEAIHETLNGLSMGWQLANVNDDAERANLQAPIIAAQEAAMNMLRIVEAMARTDGDDRQVSMAVYGRPGSISEAIAA